VTQRFAAIARAARYGFGFAYAARVQGIPTIFVEKSFGNMTAPTNYDLDASLVVDDSAAVGGVIDRKEGIGRAFPLTFGLLDTATVRTYVRRPTYTARITRTVGVTAAPLVYVESLIDNTGNKIPSVGKVYIGNECIRYGGVFPNAIVASTGEQLGPALHTTTRDLFGRRYPHDAGSVSAIAANGPISWKGRKVEVFAIPIDPFGDVDTVAGNDLLVDSAILWVGEIETRPVRDAGVWSFRCAALDRRLDAPVVAGVTAKGSFSLTQDGSAILETPTTQYPIVIGHYDPASPPSSAFGDVLVDTQITPYAALTPSEVYKVSDLRQAVAAAWNAAVSAVTELGDLTWDFDENLDAWVAKSTYTNGEVTARNLVGFVLVNFDDTNIPRQPPIRGSLDTPGPYAPPNFLVYNVAPGQTVSITLGFEAPGGDTLGAVVGAVDQGDPGALPTSGFVKVETEGGTFVRPYSALDVDDSGGLTVFVDLHELPTAHAGDVSLTFVFADAGPLKDTARRMLASTGYALNGAHDTLNRGAGYGIEEAHVDADSFDRVFDGIFSTLPLSLAVESAASFAAIYGGLFALSQRAVVMRVAADGATVGLEAVRTGLADVGAPVETITAAQLLVNGDASPVRPLPLHTSPNFVQAKTQTHGVENAGTVTFKDDSSIDAQGVVDWTYTLHGLSRSQAVGPVSAWSVALFVLGTTGQAIELDVVPWMDIEPGDSIKVDLPDHPNLWSWGTGAPGYVGPGRVLGVQRNMATGRTTLVVLVDGAFSAFTLAPSAPVSAWIGAAGAPTSIDVPLEYLPIFARFLESRAVFSVVPYLPGKEHADARYVVSAVAQVASICRLTIASVVGTHTIATTHFVTIPPVTESVPEQLDHAHTTSLGVWS